MAPNDPTTGTPVSGETGVPVVDLTTLLAQLQDQADESRINASALIGLAGTAQRVASAERRTADLLEALVTTLATGRVPEPYAAQLRQSPDGASA